MEKKTVNQELNVEVLELVFTPDEVESAESEAVKYVNANYSIRGFRKGKAPKSIIISYLGDSFDEIVFDELGKAVEEELKKEELFIPAIIVERKRTEDGGVTFVIELHREPEAEIKDYKGLELSIPKREEVLVNYVDNKLEELRNENAIIEPKEGPAEIGDVAEIEYTIVKNGKVIADKKTQEVHILEEDDRPIVTNIIGKKKGDVVEFERTFENSDNVYNYTVEVKEVFKRTLMEINDEFARSVAGEVETLEELKKKIEKEGIEAFDNWKKDFLRQQAFDKIIDFIDVKVSDKTIDYFVLKSIENLIKEKKYDSYLKQAGSEENLKNQIKESIINELKRERFIAEIAKENGIEVSEEEVLKNAEELAPYWGISVERAREIIKSREDLREDIAANLRKNKVMDLIIESATIKEIDAGESAEEGGEKAETPDTSDSAGESKESAEEKEEKQEE
ncbi:trigger factor [Kosmotoga arenicorallina S304]|uniref:Trigger factor n=1 Tax=Kosmotoga arenicorallina S304 TaxID=1453497 RepID=A0A176K1B6_9BACT|nr:trigger factor [Kosmotoga arenicorallina]OAA30901.1 trigger factor [Kosmotoga arenicorallina S304]